MDSYCCSNDDKAAVSLSPSTNKIVSSLSNPAVDESLEAWSDSLLLFLLSVFSREPFLDPGVSGVLPPVAIVFEGIFSRDGLEPFLRWPSSPGPIYSADGVGDEGFDLDFESVGGDEVPEADGGVLDFLLPDFLSLSLSLSLSRGFFFFSFSLSLSFFLSFSAAPPRGETDPLAAALGEVVEEGPEVDEATETSMAMPPEMFKAIA